MPTRDSLDNDTTAQGKKLSKKLFGKHLRHVTKQSPFLILKFSRMKLMTKALEQSFLQIGRKEFEADKLVVAKYFLPGHSATWYATEYDPIQKIFLGYVVGLQEDEWGYFSLEELESVRSPQFNLAIERDLYCGEKRLSEHLPEMAEEIKRRQEMMDIEKKLEQERDSDLER
jgi:hypothetical protein